MSLIESREGYRWALQTAQQIMGLASTIKGIDEVIRVVQRGTLGDKPEAYKEGVRKFIRELEAAAVKVGVRRRAAL